MKAHIETHHDGGTSGRDPRKLSGADLTALGLSRVSRGDAIRAKCIDCCGGSAAEVRRCGFIDCALWVFRMGTDPWRAPMPAERRATIAAQVAARRNTRAAASSQATG